MDRLSQIAAAGRSDVLPGYIFSRPRLREWGEAEEEAAQSHLRTVRTACEGSSPDIQRQMIGEAVDLISDGAFSMGMPKLDAFLRSAKTSPYLVWLCLNKKHPQVTREQAAALITEDVEEAVARAALELWGFLPPSAKKKPKTRRSNTNPSSGAESSPPSDIAA
jgi:hypothetical protein